MEINLDIIPAKVPVIFFVRKTDMSVCVCVCVQLFYWFLYVSDIPLSHSGPNGMTFIPPSTNVYGSHGC